MHGVHVVDPEDDPPPDLLSGRATADGACLQVEVAVADLEAREQRLRAAVEQLEAEPLVEGHRLGHPGGNEGDGADPLNRTAGWLPPPALQKALEGAQRSCRGQALGGLYGDAFLEDRVASASGRGHTPHGAGERRPHERHRPRHPEGRPTCRAPPGLTPEETVTTKEAHSRPAANRASRAASSRPARPGPRQVDPVNDRPARAASSARIRR